MIPILYDASETDFVHNGIGLLIDAISCKVVEVRNGAFELTLTYPQNGLYYNDLQEGCYIKAKPNDRDDEQPFRIYKTGKPIAGVCTYYAEHISYEYNSDPVPTFEITGQTAQEAITQLIEDAVIQKPYTAWSDITDRRSTSVKGVYNVRNLLGGVEGSILDTFGGELQFDKYAIKLHEARGSDNGVVIRYGKNLLDATMEKNIASVATSIFPYAFYTPQAVDGTEEEEVMVSLTEKTIRTPLADSYTHDYCIPVDFSDKFDSETIPTESALRTLATEYARSGIDVPAVSIKLSFVDLSRTKDYANLAAVEHVGLCDTVTVILERLGIVETAKVIKTDYDVLKERYNQVELGQTKPNLYTELNTVQREAFTKIVKTATRSEVLKQQFEKRIIAVTAAITGNSGGHVVLYPAENPQEILIMEYDDMSITDQNVWRWNLEGLGHSSSGINGPFETAITAAGEIVANFITAGELDGQIIKAGSIQAEALDVEYRQSIYEYADDGDAALVADYTTKFQTTNGQITAEVSRATAAEAANAANITVNANAIATKVSKGNISSEISQEAGQITISSNRLVVNSDNFKLAADGTVTTKNAVIEGEFRTDNYGDWGNAWCRIYDAVITGGSASSYADSYIDLSANYEGSTGMAINANGNYGIRLQHSGSDVMTIDANVTYYGNIYLNGHTIYESSDRNLKKNITVNDTDYTAVLRKIDLYSYDWKDGSGHVSAGFIAQDLSEYLPEVVKESKKGSLAISALKIMPYVWAILKNIDKRLCNVEKG